MTAAPLASVASLCGLAAVLVFVAGNAAAAFVARWVEARRRGLPFRVVLAETAEERAARFDAERRARVR